MAFINKQDTDGSKGNLAVGELGLDVRVGNEKVYVGLTGTDSGEPLAFEDEIITYVDNADSLKSDKSNVLELDNTNAYVPTTNYHPSTKKYVDDNAYTDTDVYTLFGDTGTIKAPLYACRAWVNFNGTGTVAIRGSGNVSSVSDVGTGKYVVNFNTVMIDNNYATFSSISNKDGSNTMGASEYRGLSSSQSAATTHCYVATGDNDSNTYFDYLNIYLAVFR